MSHSFSDPPPPLPLDLATDPRVFRQMLRHHASFPSITGTFVLDGDKVVHRNRVGKGER